MEKRKFYAYLLFPRRLVFLKACPFNGRVALAVGKCNLSGSAKYCNWAVPLLGHFLVRFINPYASQYPFPISIPVGGWEF